MKCLRCRIGAKLLRTIWGQDNLFFVQALHVQFSFVFERRQSILPRFGQDL